MIFWRAACSLPTSYSTVAFKKEIKTSAAYDKGYVRRMFAVDNVKTTEWERRGKNCWILVWTMRALKGWMGRRNEVKERVFQARNISWRYPSYLLMYAYTHVRKKCKNITFFIEDRISILHRKRISDSKTRFFCEEQNKRNVRDLSFIDTCIYLSRYFQ